MDIDIINHFSKYIFSYPVEKLNADNSIISLKTFCTILCYPKILQSDNGSESEYKNEKFKKFCEDNKIQHIFSSPYQPQTKGVIEVAHKEIQKMFMIDYSENPYHFNIKLSLLNAIEVHNSNIHTVTGYRPWELINNEEEENYRAVIDNIKKSYNRITKENEKIKKEMRVTGTIEIFIGVD